MDLSDIKINMNQFYITGVVCFLAIGLMNTFTLIRNMEFMLPTQIISSLFSIAFNVALALFFNHLRLSNPERFSFQVEKEKEVEEFVNNVEF